MRKKLAFMVLPAALALFASATVLLAADEPKTAPRQEKYFEEFEPLKQKYDENGQKVVEKKAPRKWHLYGTLGWEYDDNVKLASNDKEFRSSSAGDVSAGRTGMKLGMDYDLYRTDVELVRASYDMYANLHDDSLSEENFQKHRGSLYWRRNLTMWDRPARVSLRYRYAHGLVDHHSHSSSNGISAGWTYEWLQNWRATIYNNVSYRNYYDKGFDPGLTTRDGLYERVGFIQRYLFDNRRREISVGYEFAYNVTEGERFKKKAHGIRAGFKTPLVEKIKFETNFYLQWADYYSFPTEPHRQNTRYHATVKLKRLLNKNVEASIFYKHTHADTDLDHLLGRFSYRRNVYGAELSFRY